MSDKLVAVAIIEHLGMLGAEEWQQITVSSVILFCVVQYFKAVKIYGNQFPSNANLDTNKVPFNDPEDYGNLNFFTER